MQSLKPWHYVLFGFALLGAVFTAAWLFRDENNLAKKIVFIDAKSGELYEASTSKRTAIIPEKNPDTGTYTLFPVTKTDDGNWRIDERYLGGVDPKKEGYTAILSAQSGEVRASGSSPKSIKLGR